MGYSFDCVSRTGALARAGHPWRTAWSRVRGRMPGDDSGGLGSAALVASAKAQSSQGVSASTSARLDRRAAPDAQARRRVAIGADVVSRRLPSPAARRSSWRTSACASAGSAVTPRIDDLQADRGVGADRRDPRPGSRPSGVFATQSASALALASARAISAVRPPIDFAQFSASR